MEDVAPESVRGQRDGRALRVRVGGQSDVLRERGADGRGGARLYAVSVGADRGDVRSDRRQPVVRARPANSVDGRGFDRRTENGRGAAPFRRDLFGRASLNGRVDCFVLCNSFAVRSYATTVRI